MVAIATTLAACSSEPSHPDDPTLVAEIHGVVDDLSATYPELRKVKIDSQSLDSDVYAEAGGGRITFNSKYLSDRAEFERSMNHDVVTNFHPRTGTCTVTEFITYHEVAHILDANRDDEPSRALVDLTWTDAVDYDDLSRYSFKADGQFNAVEALAEAFAAVHCNGGNTSERNIAALLD